MKEIDISKYRINQYSQNGEDGVIEKLFEILNIKDGYLVEFGAWNGMHLSNTYHHAQKNPNFKRLLIEADPKRYEELLKTIPQTEKNILLNVLVKPEGENSLNEIFKKYSVDNIALLSIDVDGEDLKLWNSINESLFRPKIVIIEEGKWQDEESLNNLNLLFFRKGYRLICVTGNFIFVRRDFYIINENTIHEQLAASGSPEYNLYKGLITKEEFDEQVKLQQSGDKLLFKRLSKPQIIYYKNHEV